ncbi:CAS1 domain-containing protein [Beauveria brongniartii RCEF 3172]|uniref:CAS1 domain-containing protein n=1 Tax=Beauveria brongniartii RCEF 3172 TaxID=1081107 RepID=A0A166WTM2_9HYPO|nr:CAS1 domain-containing protein [Beauveria brongniartii RCEF 3172]
MTIASPAMSAVFVRVISFLTVFSVLLGLVLHGLRSHHPDPYRCQQLLDDGSWLEPPNAKGARQPFVNWQPRGCKLRNYTNEDIHECMEHRHMVFSGDSTTRQVFWAMARLLDRDASNQRRRKAGIHEDYDMKFDGIRLLQVWNPYLHVGEGTKEGHDLAYQLNLWQEEKHNNVPVADQKSAGLFLIGAGSWFALEMFHDDAIGNFSEAIAKISNIVNMSTLPPFASAPMTPHDGVGNGLFVAPVAPPFYDKLPDYRKGPIGIHSEEIDDINEFLDGVGKEQRIPLLHAFPALSRDQPEAMVDITVTGLHVIDSVAETKALILLNARCNAKLHALHGAPYDGTCCTDYGRTTFVQSVLLGLGILYVAACITVEVLNMVGRGIDWSLFDMSACMFVTALLACFLADRTQVFAKGSKEFVGNELAALLLLAAVAGIVSIRRMKPLRSDSLAQPEKLQDAPPLSRDQTDEWKGWMQAAILAYHWTGASKSLPVYIFIRLLVAAYLFQIGYGHTFYFLVKKDFSLKRVAAVMLRLNLLSCALPYIMNTNYMLYYFAPLASFWFAIVYLTLAIKSDYNDTASALLIKTIISASAVASVFLFTPMSEWIFTVLRYAFRIDWDLHEWQFRVSLDSLIVYVGMLAGMASANGKSWDRLLVQSKLPGLVGLAVLAGYCYLSNQLFEVKQDYNKWHPYISFIPIIAWIAARNVAAPLRVYYSKAFAWLGRCSLETFTLQFHLFLASDTKGILLLDGLTGDGSLATDRWRHLVVIVPLFLWISHATAEATGHLTKRLTSESGEQDKTEGSNDYEQLIPEPGWQHY